MRVLLAVLLLAGCKPDEKVERPAEPIDDGVIVHRLDRTNTAPPPQLNGDPFTATIVLEEPPLLPPEVIEPPFFDEMPSELGDAAVEPEFTDPFDPPPPVDEGVEGGVPGGVIGGEPGGVVGGMVGGVLGGVEPVDPGERSFSRVKRHAIAMEPPSIELIADLVPPDQRLHLSVRFCVNRKGRVFRAELRRSSGNDPLDDAFVEAVLRWRFKPFRKDKRRVEVCSVADFDVVGP